MCDQLGVPLAAHKKEDPTTCLMFLGIEIDTEACELRQPQDKLDRLGNLLSQWSKKKACTTRDLQFLVGHLNHVCKVVRPGQSFLRRIIDLLQVSLARRHRASAVRLNLGFRSDMAWWTEFVCTWNGTAFLTTGDLAPTAEFTSDASGSWGCGAWHGHQWLQIPWDSKAQALDVSCKEVIPIILASATWGHKWAGYQVVCHCDNQVAVAALRSRSSRQPHLMHLLRCVAFAEASLNFNISATYISTRSNHLADDPSRDRVHTFL